MRCFNQFIKKLLYLRSYPSNQINMIQFLHFHFAPVFSFPLERKQCN